MTDVTYRQRLEKTIEELNQKLKKENLQGVGYWEVSTHRNQIMMALMLDERLAAIEALLERESSVVIAGEPFRK